MAVYHVSQHTFCQERGEHRHVASQHKLVPDLAPVGINDITTCSMCCRSRWNCAAWEPDPIKLSGHDIQLEGAGHIDGHSQKAAEAVTCCCQWQTGLNPLVTERTCTRDGSGEVQRLQARLSYSSLHNESE